jgi:hypothetical protein
VTIHVQAEGDAALQVAARPPSWCPGKDELDALNELTVV